MATRPRHLEPSWRWKPRLESRPTTIFSSLFHRASIFVRPKRSMAVSNNLAPQGWNPEWSRNCRRRLHYITSRVTTRNCHRLSDETSKHQELKNRASELIYDQEKTSAESFKSALIECVRSPQKSYYSGDIFRMSSGIQVHKTSRIMSLNPYLDKNGLLRVEGRLEHAKRKAKTRFPLIISHDHPLARLIILHGHETVRHTGKIGTLAEIRGRYWITKSLATVGKNIRNCITCRMAGAKAKPPRMAPLPAHRLQSHIRPLTNVGIDYFGPFNTVVGRRQEKS